MHLADFKTEQWMNDHEGNALYNMTDTCVEPLTWRELLAMDTDHLLDHVTMDYGDITGKTELKQAILSLYENGTVENITMAQGCLQANEMVMDTLLNPGDTVLTFTPGYQQFTDIPKAIGCHVIELPLYEDRGWMPDFQEIEKAMKKPVKMIILNHPSNPTGSFLQREDLKRLIGLAEKADAWILSDEVYRGLHEQEDSVADLYEKGISTSSFSKLFSLAGLRLGWIKANREVIHAINVRRDYTIISTGPLADTLGLIAMNHKDELLERSRKITDGNKQVLREFLAEDPRFSCVIPDAGTVCFLRYEGKIESSVFAEEIQKKYGVFYVPGSCFDCENHLRLGLTRDPKQTRRGLELTARFLREALQ